MSDAAIYPPRALDPAVASAIVVAALTAVHGRVPVAEARILLCHVLGWSHARLASYPEQVLTSRDWRQFRRLVERRELGEPMAYIIGRREFYGRTFQVSPAVLIPRPETELLVDAALEYMSTRVAPKVLDLGTGSGVLAITLALELPGAVVTALDRSAEALAVARRNAESLGAPVRFRRSDWFAQLSGERFDLIVANPPYVAAGDPHLSHGDLPFEPGGALADGSADGLDSIARICQAVCEHLEPGGWLWLEHGWNQAARVRALMRQSGLSALRSRRDVAGILRIGGGRR